LWEHYYPDADVIIFVIDSSDKLRISVAKDELETLLSHKLIKARSIPVIFFANKMDLDGISPAEISNALGLETIKSRNWTICATNALTGAGVEAGFDWIADQLGENKR
jgi:ADP-ribosylation factor-like protein 6